MSVLQMLGSTAPINSSVNSQLSTLLSTHGYQLICQLFGYQLICQLTAISSFVNQPINRFCQLAYQPFLSTILSIVFVNEPINRFCQPAYQPINSSVNSSAISSSVNSQGSPRYNFLLVMQPASDDHNNTESIEHYNRGALHTHLNMCLLCSFSTSPLALSQSGVRQLKKVSINPCGILAPTI